MLTHKGTQALETPRLLLRKAIYEDVQPMFDNRASDPEVTKYLTWPAHSSVQITELVIDSWIKGYAEKNQYLWIIVLKDSSQPIGSISVVAHHDEIGKAEIGYCIGKSWWHKGIMTEALQAVLDYLFDEVGFQRLEARHDPNNPHSGEVMRKCGMQYEGTTRRSDRNNQGICDACLYGLLADQRRNG